jgi:hypothetical protein
MTYRGKQQLPVARRERLLVEELPDEVLVYDLDRKKALCLNRTAALIWNQCNGKTSVEQITLFLRNQSAADSASIDEDVVWFALEQLRKSRLLDEPVARNDGKPNLSRRELVKRIGLAASVPLVVSILAPTASAALSCAGRICTGNPGICGACTCNGTVCV